MKDLQHLLLCAGIELGLSDRHHLTTCALNAILSFQRQETGMQINKVPVLALHNVPLGGMLTARGGGGVNLQERGGGVRADLQRLETTHPSHPPPKNVLLNQMCYLKKV